MGKRQPSKSAPQELHFSVNHDPGYRVPHIVADLAAAHPIHLGIIDGVQTVGLTAGASAPEVLVEDVIDALRRLGPVDVSQLTGRQETIEFRLPPELSEGRRSAARAEAKV